MDNNSILNELEELRGKIIDTIELLDGYKSIDIIDRNKFIELLQKKAMDTISFSTSYAEGNFLAKKLEKLVEGKNFYAYDTFEELTKEIIGGATIEEETKHDYVLYHSLITEDEYKTKLSENEVINNAKENIVKYREELTKFDKMNTTLEESNIIGRLFYEVDDFEHTLEKYDDFSWYRGSFIEVAEEEVNGEYVKFLHNVISDMADANPTITEEDIDVITSTNVWYNETDTFHDEFSEVTGINVDNHK